MDKNKGDHSQIQIARISAKQAIIVALITAIAGVITGLLATGGFNKTDSSLDQRWLIIEGVELVDRPQSEQQVRLIININGYSFSYPSRSLFAVIGPQMSKERFPIINEKEYKISFAAVTSTYSFERNEAELEVKEQLSQKVDLIKSNQVPTDLKFYDLYPVYSGTRGSDPELRIKYSIE